jgi:hypothetical protein
MVETEGEQFSLRWNNFHSNLTAGFHALLQGEDLVDVTLAAAGQFVQAHKIVLSVCSPYFKELFKVSMEKYLKGTIKLLNKGFQQNVIDFIAVLYAVLCSVFVICFSCDVEFSHYFASIFF